MWLQKTTLLLPSHLTSILINAEKQPSCHSWLLAGWLGYFLRPWYPRLSSQRYLDLLPPRLECWDYRCTCYTMSSVWGAEDELSAHLFFKASPPSYLGSRRSGLGGVEPTLLPDWSDYFMVKLVLREKGCSPQSVCHTLPLETLSELSHHLLLGLL